MRLSLAASLAVVAVLAGAPAAAAELSRSEVKAANQGLEKDDPEYIRCKREPVLGSRVKKTRMCLSNRDWDRYAEQGRAYIEDAFSGGSSTSN